MGNVPLAHVVAPGYVGDTRQREGWSVVTYRLLPCSEDRVRAEDSPLARWVADPANTAWMDSKLPARQGCPRPTSSPCPAPVPSLAR